MKFKSRIYGIIVLFIVASSIILTNYVLALDLSQGLEIPLTPRGFNIVIDKINVSNIMEHVKFFSSASRFTGYSGFFEAANYITSKFEEYGLQHRGENGTYFEYFEITTPIDHGSSITLENGDVIKAYALYPNLVNPCPYISPEEGDKLVYVGKGDLKDFENLDIRDKFVLMDFASRWNFYQAISGGAKGVIFVPETPELVIRPEAEQKEVLIPIYFPRLYVRLEDGGEELINLAKRGGNGGVKIYINAKMTWESISVPNIVGYIKGRDERLSKQIIVVSAYYDSWSIVPALSYGATDSLGISVLLEFARFLSTHIPKKSVLLVALAGHYQGLWGAREFVEKHFNELQNEIVAFAGMDLSSGSKTIGVYATGSAYTYRTQTILCQQRYSSIVSQIFNIYLMEMRMILGIDYGENFVDGILGSNPLYLASIRPYEPRLYGFFGTVGASSSLYYQSLTYLFDSDPFVVAMYGCGWTYHTTDEVRLYQRTPADTYEKINFENLLHQTKFIYCTLWGFLNEEKFEFKSTKTRLSDDWGYVTLKVKVSEYNFLTSWYDPFDATRRPDEWNDVIVLYSMGTGAYVVSKIDEKGEVIIHGLKPYQTGFVDAFVVDRESGKITWATDVGVWMAPGGKVVSLTSHPYEKIISMFPCASIAILLTFNPVDFRFIPMMIINMATGHGIMIRQNQLSSDMFYMAFVMPETPTEIIFTMGEKTPIAVLNDADPQNPDGKGYILKQGEMLSFGPEEVSRNLKTMVLNRYDRLISYSTYTPSIQLFYSIISKYLPSWEQYYAESEASRLLGYSYTLWQTLLGLYYSVMDLIWQVILSLSVIFIITIPFAFIVERLVFSFQGKKRFVTVVMMAFLSNFIFSLFHPGFTIATSSLLVIISNCLLATVAPLLLLIINETQKSIKSLREKIRGAAHFAEISRSGLFASSMSISIENMKKRKFRTLLTLISLILLTFGMVSLSSITLAPQYISGAPALPNPSSFSGIIIRSTTWAPMHEGMYKILESSLSDVAIVAPIAYLYPPPAPPRGVIQLAERPYIIFSPKMQTRIYGMLALSHKEPEISGIDEFLIPPSNWFSEDDVFSVILPDTVATSLSEELVENITVGSEINLYGLKLKVIGIINSEELNKFYNPDGEKIAPIDPTSPTTAIAPSRFNASNILIIPYSLLSRLVYPTPISMVVIKPFNETVKERLLNELPLMILHPIYAAKKGEVGYYLLQRQWISLIGFQYLLIPVAIVSLAILNFMLGSIYERTREIAIYNAIGMSPFHISVSFLIEAISYALPAIFSGYLAGIAITNLMVKLKIYPESLYPNFSSYTALIVLLIGFAVTSLSSVYPSLLAARLAVPSHTRRWYKTISRPKSDVWEIIIPTIANTREEVLGVFHFIQEYLSFSMERESLFAAEKVNIEDIHKGEGEIFKLIADCRMAPYDMGIKSDIIVEAEKINKESPFLFKLTIRRTSGYAATWRVSCPHVADELRRQILIWRTIPDEERRRHIKLAGEWQIDEKN